MSRDRGGFCVVEAVRQLARGTMALKSERSRIRFKDIESVPSFDPVRRAGLSASFPEPAANEERGMSSKPLPIGEELRRAREEAGLELADVAAHLRIRSNFLSALEEGRPDALPGITYAIGYVRTYAAFLGLEPDAAVRRFKEEAAGLNSKTQLVFPSPAPEGRVPGLVLMLVAAMLAGGAYGGWYWLSERDGSLRDLVPAVPERLAQLIEGEAPSLPAATRDTLPATGTYADANPAGVAVPRAAVPATAPANTQVAPEAASPPTAAAPTSTTVPAAAPAGASPAAAPLTAVPATAAPADIAPAPTAGVTPLQAPASPIVPPADEPAPTATTAADDTPDVTAPPEPAGTALAAGTGPRQAATTIGTRLDAVDEVPAAPRIAGLIGASEAAVPSGRATAGPIDRVMIRATGDSWVQVRDSQGTALFTRVLREGDIYRVPDQAGLRLATGNAGALQILVDGSPAPRLGDFGEVVRNVALEPSRLAAGTAISGSR